MAAERLMLLVLDSDFEADENLSDEVVIGAQVVLLGALVTVEYPEDATLDDLVSDAGKIADYWIAEREGSA